VPVVRESLFVAARNLKDADIPLVGADMDGAPVDSVDLTGPMALASGEEGRGLSPPLRARCRSVVAVPLAGGLESLNVSVAAGILLYEKRRQDRARGAVGQAASSEGSSAPTAPPSTRDSNPAARRR
jgi:23S rRNA (guanosine2251-2'-O)-methyltransferase